jgi:hypothetical protein
MTKKGFGHQTHDRTYLAELKREYPDGSEWDLGWDEIKVSIAQQQKPSEAEWTTALEPIAVEYASQVWDTPIYAGSTANSKPNKIFIWKSRDSPFPVMQLGKEPWQEKDGIQPEVAWITKS